MAIQGSADGYTGLTVQMAIQGGQCRWLYWAGSADGYTGLTVQMAILGSADGYTGLTLVIHLQEELYVSGLHELGGGGGGGG